MLDPTFVRAMPKVELHVHLEGSIRPETVLALAQKNRVELPADTIEGIRDWYRFRDFEHFVEVYVAVSKCVRTPENIETIAYEFLKGQAEQNILYTEATYTAATIEKHCGIPFDEQIGAVRSAQQRAANEHGCQMSLILDIVRGDDVDRAWQVFEWVCSALGDGVCALGLAGIERLGSKQYRPVFEEAARRGVPVTVHAGETCGPESVWEALELTATHRIGHGVRAVEDPALIAELVSRDTVLEICPSSNVCLGVFPSLAEHSLPALRDAGIAVTINSDDPPMFGTTLTEEWLRAGKAFGFGSDDVWQMTDTAIKASFLEDSKKEALRQRVANGFYDAVGNK